LLISGGRGSGGSSEIYKVRTGKWTKISYMRKERYCHTIIIQGDYAYAIGGMEMSEREIHSPDQYEEGYFGFDAHAGTTIVGTQSFERLMISKCFTERWRHISVKTGELTLFDESCLKLSNEVYLVFGRRQNTVLNISSEGIEKKEEGLCIQGTPDFSNLFYEGPATFCNGRYYLLTKDNSIFIFDGLKWITIKDVFPLDEEDVV